MQRLPPNGAAGDAYAGAEPAPPLRAAPPPSHHTTARARCKLQALAIKPQLSGASGDGDGDDGDDGDGDGDVDVDMEVPASADGGVATHPTLVPTVASAVRSFVSGHVQPPTSADGGFRRGGLPGGPVVRDLVTFVVDDFLLPLLHTCTKQQRTVMHERFAWLLLTLSLKVGCVVCVCVGCSRVVLHL